MHMISEALGACTGLGTHILCTLRIVSLGHAALKPGTPRWRLIIPPHALRGVRWCMHAHSSLKSIAKPDIVSG